MSQYAQERDPAWVPATTDDERTPLAEEPVATPPLVRALAGTGAACIIAAGIAGFVALPSLPVSLRSGLGLPVVFTVEVLTGLGLAVAIATGRGVRAALGAVIGAGHRFIGMVAIALAALSFSEDGFFVAALLGTIAVLCCGAAAIVARPSAGPAPLALRLGALFVVAVLVLLDVRHVLRILDHFGDRPELLFNMRLVLASTIAPSLPVVALLLALWRSRRVAPTAILVAIGTSVGLWVVNRLDGDPLRRSGGDGLATGIGLALAAAEVALAVAALLRPAAPSAVGAPDPDEAPAPAG